MQSILHYATTYKTRIVDYTGLRNVYRLRVLLYPHLWLRTESHRVDRVWDDLLWNMLVNQEIVYAGKCTALIGKHVVWIANAPYADGCMYSDIYNYYRPVAKQLQCSRSTALLLREEVAACRIMAALQGLTFVEIRNINGTIIT